MTDPHHRDGRASTGARRSQGRGARAPAAAVAASLDGARSSAGYDHASRERIDVRHVAQQIDLMSVLAQYSILDGMRKRGRQLIGMCPVHRGSHVGQFVVDPTKGTWFCFGDCHRGGDALALIAGIEELTTRDAARTIAERSGITLTPLPSPRARRLTMTEATNRPTHKVFAVQDRGENTGADDKAFWTRVGSAFPHKDGKGLSIVLSALPVNARLVLREFDEQDESPRPKSKTTK